MRAVMLAALLACSSPVAEGQIANPTASCQILVDPVVFGTYSALSRVPELSTGRVELRCLGGSVGPEARVSLSQGTSGRYNERTLMNAAARLTYNLYVDASRQIIAGDGSQGTSTLAPFPVAGLKQFRGGLQAAARVVFRIYGRLDPGQIVPAGEYTDTIQVIVEF